MDLESRNLGIKKLKLSEPDPTQDGFFETTWDVRIWKELNKTPIWQKDIKVQWDEIPSVGHIMALYLQDQNEFAIGFSVYNQSCCEKKLKKELGIE